MGGGAGSWGGGGEGARSCFDTRPKNGPKTGPETVPRNAPGTLIWRWPSAAGCCGCPWSKLSTGAAHPLRLSLFSPCYGGEQSGASKSVHVDVKGSYRKSLPQFWFSWRRLRSERAP